MTMTNEITQANVKATRIANKNAIVAADRARCDVATYACADDAMFARMCATSIAADQVVTCTYIAYMTAVRANAASA
jgi:hypothetical protein